MTSPDLHLDTGAMALDALPEDERAAFVAHLDDCETCRPELAEFTETVARLAVLTAARPPAGLKQRVLEAIATTPQLPPLTDVGRHRATDTTDGTGAAGAAGVAARVEGPPTAASPVPDVIPLRPWYRRTTTLIAAAVVAIALVVGGAVVANRATTGDVAAELAACVATAPDATVTRPTVGDVGDVRYAPSCGAATVNVTGIAAPPAGQQYQMWFIAGSTVTSAGLMSQDAASPESHTVTVPVTDPAAMIGITAEPAGGSAQPTSNPLWVAPIQS
jgi:hypothetical protein